MGAERSNEEQRSDRRTPYLEALEEIAKARAAEVRAAHRFIRLVRAAMYGKRLGGKPVSPDPEWWNVSPAVRDLQVKLASRANDWEQFVATFWMTRADRKEVRIARTPSAAEREREMVSLGLRGVSAEERRRVGSISAISWLTVERECAHVELPPVPTNIRQFEKRVLRRFETRIESDIHTFERVGAQAS